MDFMPLIFVMLLATSFPARHSRSFVRERESSLLVIVFTSVVCLFLSGPIWPRYAFSPFWKMISDLVPATWGMEGFIRINSNGSTRRCQPLLHGTVGSDRLYFISAVVLRHFTSKAHADRQRQGRECAEVSEI